MHVEPPKEPLMSLREFGLHYLMIVVSILTAIGLEEVLRFHHDAEAAKSAEESIEREVFANLSDLRDAVKQNRERLEATKKFGDSLAEDIRTIKDQQVLQKKILETMGKNFQIGILIPGLEHEAWDVAVASQAASHIPREKLQAYSAAYSIERDSIGGVTSGMVLMDGPRLIDVGADVEIGLVDPRRCLEVVREAQGALGSSLGNLASAEKEVTKALDKAGIRQQ